MLTAANRQGVQGHLDNASKGTLENEFGTSDEEECLKKILTEGTLQNAEVGISFAEPTSSTQPRL
jgi:hypothetical protein